jgi:hypothetical protein
MVFILGEKSRFPYIPMRWMMAYMTTMLVLFGHFLYQGQKEAAKAKKLAKILPDKQLEGSISSSSSSSKSLVDKKATASPPKSVVIAEPRASSQKKKGKKE